MPKFPVLAIVDNLVLMELIDVMCDWGAVNIIQRPAIDKQSVLLHILETEHPNVRIICAADPHILQMVKDKEFRANLFYLLRATDIRILPLRDVTEDIPGLADFFLTRHAKDNDEPKKHLDSSALKALKLHP